MTPEGRVKKMVKAALDNFGADCWRFMPVQTGYGSPALDYLTCIHGRFVAIETKAPGKKLTPMQEATKAAIEAAGGIVLVVWDETSLALAMKIILGLEFDSATTEYGRENAAHLNPQAQGLLEQHRRDVKQAQEADDAAGGDHGAPRTAPARRSKSGARVENQPVTAAVTTCTCGAPAGDRLHAPGCALIREKR